MRGKDVDYVQLLWKAFKESNGNTVDLVIEHELHGVTPEMLDWWWGHINDNDNYRLWCPRDHVAFRVELIQKGGGKGEPIGIGISTEKIAEFPASDLRMHLEEVSSIPIPVVFGKTSQSSILGPDNKPIGWILHDYKIESYGTKMRSTFRFPAKTPQKFLKAMRNHNQAEMGELPKFLPGLCKKKG